MEKQRGTTFILALMLSMHTHTHVRVFLAERPEEEDSVESAGDVDDIFRTLLEFTMHNLGGQHRNIVHGGGGGAKGPDRNLVDVPSTDKERIQQLITDGKEMAIRINGRWYECNPKKVHLKENNEVTVTVEVMAAIIVEELHTKRGVFSNTENGLCASKKGYQSSDEFEVGGESVKDVCCHFAKKSGQKCKQTGNEIKCNLQGLKGRARKFCPEGYQDWLCDANDIDEVEKFSFPGKPGVPETEEYSCATIRHPSKKCSCNILHPYTQQAFRKAFKQFYEEYGKTDAKALLQIQAHQKRSLLRA